MSERDDRFGTEPNDSHGPWTPAAERRLRRLLDDPAWQIPAGLGNAEDGACSLASINLALTGELWAAPPDCMSLVIAAWIFKVQDAMPAKMRNSREWRTLLPLAAGTGRDPLHEEERSDTITEWWERVASVEAAGDSRWRNADSAPGGFEWWQEIDPVGLLAKLVAVGTMSTGGGA